MRAEVISRYGPPPELYPEMPYDEELERMSRDLRNISELMLDRHVKSNLGDKTAVVSGGVRKTYSELLNDTDKLAKGLCEIGVEKGDRIMTKLSNSYELILTLLAALRVGAVIIPCHPLFAKREIEYIAKNSDAKLLVTDENSAKELKSIINETQLHEIVTTEESESFRSLKELTQTSALSEYVKLSPEEVAVLLYTSGTTGKPKGCIHSHKEYLAVAYCYAEKTLHCRKEDIITGVPSIAFAYGHTGLFGNPLILGETTVLMQKFEPEILLETIEHERTTVLLVTPTVMKIILAKIPEPRKEYDLSSLRLTLSAGEVCPPTLYSNWMEKIGCIHIQHIGSTEMFNGFVSTTPEKQKPGALGFPVHGYSVRIVKDDWRDCKPFEEGLLLVKGPTGTRYWRDSETQRKAVHDGWNITGDVCYFDEEGFIWYVGRVDDIIKSSGYRISPAEIEDVLIEHPCISDAAVIGVADEKRGQIVKAYLVLKEGCDKENVEREIVGFLQSRLARYKVPRIFEYVDELPKTVTGKVKRSELRKREG